MTDDADREAFEAWLRAFRPVSALTSQFLRENDGRYCDWRISDDLDVWLAALASERAKTGWKTIDVSPIGHTRRVGIWMPAKEDYAGYWDVATWSASTNTFWKDGSNRVYPSHWCELSEPPK